MGWFWFFVGDDYVDGVEAGLGDDGEEFYFGEA